MTHKTFIPFLRRISVLALAALAIMALLACPGKHKNYDDDDEEDEKEVTGALQIDDEFLNSFDPNVPFEQTGHSQPFTIHPREDMTISAEAGAFERDVNIRVTDVPAEMMNALDRQLEGSGTTMVFAYDLDAGLPPDSVIPGKYTVSIDLEKHGIPEELYPYFVMYRVAGDGNLQPLNVKIKGRTAIYMASQNSITLAAVAYGTIRITATVGIFIYGAARYPAIKQTIRRRIEAGVWSSDPLDNDDAVCLHIDDDFGNFYVSYLYGMTENGDKKEEYIKKKKKLKKLIEELRQEAKEKYDNEHPRTAVDRDAEAAGRFFGNNDYVVEERRIGREWEYYQMLTNDPRMQELREDPVLQVPQSVLDIITATKLSNRYCRTVQHMKPFSYEYVTYLTPKQDATPYGESPGTLACRWQLPFFDPVIIVIYEEVVKNGKYEKDSYWSCLTTIAHETLHLYQMEYVNCSLVKDDCYLEATGALIEEFFTDWLIKTVPGMPVNDARSEATAERMGYSNRFFKEMLSTPLEKKCPDYKGIELTQHSRGYMMADMLEYLWDNRPNPRDTITFDKMMNHYSINKGIFKTMKDVFGIENDQDFTKYYEGFCEKFIDEIENRQSKYRKISNGDGLVMPNVEHDPQHCIMRVDKLGERCGNTAQPFMVNTFRIVAKDGAQRRYNLFAETSANLLPSLMKFTFFSKNKFTDNQKYFTPDYSRDFPKEATAAVITRPACKDKTLNNYFYYDIVALYEPTATPEVKGPSLDKKGLLVKPQCTASQELMEKDYVTGLQIVMENNKTGNLVSYIDKVTDWKDEFVAAYDRLGITDTTNVDVSLRSRWYYETAQGQRYYSPATDIVNYKRQNARVEQTVEQDTTVVEDEPGIVGDDDHGLAGLVVDEKFYLILWGFEGLEDHIFPSDNESTHSGAREAVARLKVYADGSFMIDAPAINFTKRNSRNSSDYMNYTYSDIHIEGKGQFEGTDESQYYKISNLNIPMQTFHLNMNGSVTEDNKTRHPKMDIYFDVKSGRGSQLIISRKNGKTDMFGIEIPDVMMKIRGSSGDEHEEGERQQSFILGGQVSQP
ncbi:MAG: hypothetical protein K5896_02340 [Prevotella sp.]|nr:hypothetical protein [Prevotella sp.]